MKVNAWKAGTHPRSWPQVASLSLCCFGVLAGLPSWGQAPMPPAAPKQEATTPLPDPFYEALEGLSKKYSVAFVAEGAPFLAGKSSASSTPSAAGASEEAGTNLPPSGSLKPEEVLQKVAEKYDYDAIRQGNVYRRT
jgi:hypothetical protein